MKSYAFSGQHFGTFTTQEVGSCFMGRDECRKTELAGVREAVCLFGRSFERVWRRQKL